MPQYEEWDVLRDGSVLGSVTIAFIRGRPGGCAVGCTVPEAAGLALETALYGLNDIESVIRRTLAAHGIDGVEIKPYRSWTHRRTGPAPATVWYHRPA